MTGDIDMNNHSIENIPAPSNDNSVVSKKYVQDNYLSQLGGTIGGNLYMGQFEILELALTPHTARSAVSKGWVETMIAHGRSSRSIDDTGFTMTGDINMGGNKIINLDFIPQTDTSAVSKKWVEDEFPKKSQVLGGFVLSGALDMNGNEIYNLPSVSTTDGSAVSREYVEAELAKYSSGFIMAGNVDMNNHRIENIPTPTNDNDAVSKKYVDSKFATGITQQHNRSD